MQNPLVSILTPFKNTASYIDECLESIINQSYTNWELLIVDDHSTDDSYAIVENYALKEDRIKLYQNTGNGIIDALRVAFKNSSGDFITRMDSDDVMTSNKLEVLSKNLLEKGMGSVAIGQVKYFSDEGISEGYEKYQTWLNALTGKGDNYSEIYKECVIPSPNWMIHRSDLVACGAFEHDRYPEDYDLTFRFYEKGYSCIPCNEVLHYWRDYATRTSRTHEHYAQNYFLDIKLHYFLKLDHDPNRPLVIWGAGFKGKTIAQKLTENKIPFHWICDNPKKIGKKIYGQELLPFEHLEHIKNAQSIITVANEDAQREIRSFLSSRQMRPMSDYYFFC